jgi:hypothetical protein
MSNITRAGAKNIMRLCPKLNENSDIMTPVILIRLFQLEGGRVLFLEYAILCC